jgi:hypothetical protein
MQNSIHSTKYSVFLTINDSLRNLDHMCIHIIAAFIQWAKAICDEDSLDVKINHLKKTFTHNGTANMRSCKTKVSNIEGTGSSDDTIQSSCLQQNGQASLQTQDTSYTYAPTCERQLVPKCCRDILHSM